MAKFRCIRFALLVMTVRAIGAAELPAQFQVWGTRGPGLPPAPPGWVEVRAEPRLRNVSEPNRTEVANGFVLFQRRPFAALYHDTVPAGPERAVRLQAFAARGQYEPLSFGLHALVALKDVRVTVGELKDRAEDQIPSSFVDIRLVMPVRSPVAYGNSSDRRFSLVPFYLEKRESFDLPQGRTAQLWLTVKVPENAKPGDYEGRVRIETGGGAVRELPLLLRVLPFTLPPTPIETAISYYPTADPALREQEMIDQREHGINANESTVAAQVVSRDRHFGEDDAAATRESIKAALRLRKRVWGDAANRLPLTVEVGHQVLYDWDARKGWFHTWPRSPELESDFFHAIKVCQETIQAEGGPSMRLFIMDEPGGHPDTLQEAVYYHKLVRERLPGLQTYVTLGGGLSLGIDELGLFGPCTDLITVNRFDAAICRQLMARHKPYGVYNGGGATEAVTGYTRDRYFYGFYGWKTGASEILQWVYRFGEAWKDPLRGNHGYVMPAADGPLPSIPWESLRAGIDDYRYLDLLWRLIAVAKSAPGDAELAKAGERAALEAVDEVDFRYQPRTGQGTSAPACGTLDLWRWKVAAACLELLKVVPLETALRTDAVRPGPLDLPTPKPGDDGVQYGPELLPETGFENGLGPWKMAGQKVSRGGLDNMVAHTGKASFALENSGTATGMDVVVCVWGWGGPGPNVKLQPGKTYEFSAFIKADSARPQIRLAMPDGAALRESEGEDPVEASGWRRLWRRVTAAKETQPTYLAVWLQGPGRIWADDLSFREAVLPPFVVCGDQPLIDGSDRNLTFSIKQFGPIEISVSAQLPGGKGIRMVKVPPQGEAFLDFDPAGLPLGPHEVRFELSQPEGTAYVSKLGFIRVRGPFDPQ